MIKIAVTTKDDLELVQKLWKDGRVMKWVGFPDGLEMSAEDMLKWYERLQQTPNEEHYSLFDTTGEYVGETFYRYHPEETEVDIKLVPSQQGKSYASVGLSYVMSKVFVHDPNTVIIVDPHPENLQAYILYERLGFKKTTRFKVEGHFVFECRYVDFKPHKKIIERYVSLTPYEEKDDRWIWEVSEAQSDYDWQAWDGPYFEKSEPLTYDQYLDSKQRKRYLEHPDMVRIIRFMDQPIGIMNSYWIDEKTRWLEIGGVVFESIHWSKGYGRQAFRKWLDFQFERHPEIQNIGLTTWSGNQRMMKVANWLGMKQEAQRRNMRYHLETYYDSLSYGITRFEYELRKRFPIEQIDPREVQLPKRVSLNMYEILALGYKVDENLLGFILLNQKNQNTFEIVHLNVIDTEHQKAITEALLFEAKILGRMRDGHFLEIKINPRELTKYQGLGFHILDDVDNVYILVQTL